MLKLSSEAKRSTLKAQLLEGVSILARLVHGAEKFGLEYLNHHHSANPAYPAAE